MFPSFIAPSFPIGRAVHWLLANVEIHNLLYMGRQSGFGVRGSMLTSNKRGVKSWSCLPVDRVTFQHPLLQRAHRVKGCSSGKHAHTRRHAGPGLAASDRDCFSYKYSNEKSTWLCIVRNSYAVECLYTGNIQGQRKSTAEGTEPTG